MSGAADMAIAESEAIRPRPKHIHGQSPPRSYNDAVERIVAAVAPHFGVMPLEVFSSSRSRSVAAVRAISMHVSRQRYGHSHHELGRFFGRDQSSTAYALKKADRLLATDDRVARLVGALLEHDTAIGSVTP